MTSKIRCCGAILLVVSIILVVLSPFSAKAGAFNVNKKKAIMEVDSFLQIKTTGSSGKIKWSSSDKSVATVSKKGKITAKAEGSCVIYAKDGSDICSVQVKVEDSNKEEKADTKKADKSETTLKPSTVYNENGITITADKYTHEYSKSSLKLTIQNNRSDDITYSANSVIINGFSFTYTNYGTLYSGKKASMQVDFYDSDLEYAHVNVIEEYKIPLSISSKDGDSLFKCTVNVKTSAYETGTGSYEFSGSEAYNKDGLRIVLLKSKNPSLKHPFGVFVENNTDQDMFVSFSNLYYNDELIASIVSGFNVLAHTKYAGEQSFFLYGDIGIDQLEKVDLELYIQPKRNDGWVSSADVIISDLVSITYT